LKLSKKWDKSVVEHLQRVHQRQRGNYQLRRGPRTASERLNNVWNYCTTLLCQLRHSCGHGWGWERNLVHAVFVLIKEFQMVLGAVCQVLRTTQQCHSTSSVVPAFTCKCQVRLYISYLQFSFYSRFRHTSQRFYVSGAIYAHPIGAVAIHLCALMRLGYAFVKINNIISVLLF